MKQYILLSFICTLFLYGCAFDVIKVKQEPTTFKKNNNCNLSFILAKDTEALVSGGYDQILRKNTNWNCIGSIPQGNVFKTKDQILTVEASNIFEAYIVVSSDNNNLVGFYLPVENAFSPAEDQVKLITY